MDNTVLYRIIDANFNRCREALRVMEEYCRFGLNHAGLAGRAKQLRHRLSEAVSRLDAVKLLCSRDTGGDVGRAMAVDGQLRRQSLEDCFTAAAKRAGEALRALAEALQSIDAGAAAVMEQLRFEVYALEQETVLKASVAAKWAAVRLYILINANPNTPREEILQLIQQCIAGGADCLQLRAKGLPDGSLLALAEAFVAVCRQAGVVSIINDRADIAILSGADGVHLGQDEIPVCKARQLSPMPLIIGVSTHSQQELTPALTSGCDYVAIGPAFPSPTKPELSIAGVDYLKAALPQLERAGLWHVAIGGINPANIPALLDIGVRTVAVSAAICQTENPKTSCKALKEMLLK
jgi:thiamine-phosphate pyrophosphorylase